MYTINMDKKLTLVMMYSLLVVSVLIILIVEVVTRGSTDSTDKYPLSVSGNLRFHVIGDYGELEKEYEFVNNTYRVELVAESMNARATEHPISMIVTVGDNRYHDTSGIFDRTFFNLLQKVFEKPHLQSKPWFGVLGNHDCYRNPDFQVSMNDLYPKWNLMDSQSMEIPIGKDKKAKMIYLNSCVLVCQNYTQHDEVKSECEDFYNKPSIELIEEQYAWLEKDLKSTDRNMVPWILVYLHHPLFNAGKSHGDTEILKKVLYKYLSDYKVDLVFVGHEHNTQYFVSPYDSPYDESDRTDECFYMESAPYGRQATYEQGKYLHEVVIGSSSKPVDKFCPKKLSTMAEMVYGNSINNAYNEVEITPEQITVNYIDADYYKQNNSDFLNEIIFTTKIIKT